MQLRAQDVGRVRFPQKSLARTKMAIVWEVMSRLALRVGRAFKSSEAKSLLVSPTKYCVPPTNWRERVHYITKSVHISLGVYKAKE
jgi:hypothetical protein